MKKTITITAMAIFFALCFTQNIFCAASASDEAEQCYVRGEYDKAIDIYTSELKKGGESGELYFNIGNCYLQKGDEIGKAIFFYEMARRFIPRDGALLVNLKYARSLMKQPDAPVQENLALRILKSAFSRLTMKESFIVWNTFYVLCVLLFAASLFAPSGRLALKILSVLFLISALIAVVPLKAKIEYENRAGFIVTPTADARLEPLEDTAPGFPLYEGMEVHVLKKTNKWYKVRRPDGKIGWIAKNSLLWMKSPQF